MDIRLVSVAAALALSIAAPATSAFAQDAGTLSVWGARIDAAQASRSIFGMAAWVDGLRSGDANVAPRRPGRLYRAASTVASTARPTAATPLSRID